MIFHAWVYTREKKNLGPIGDPLFEARLVMKHRGLKRLDTDNNYTLQVVHPNKMYFNKQREKNKYHILATFHVCVCVFPATSPCGVSKS